MKGFIAGLILASSLAAPHLGMAAVPQTISYQGKLVVANTNYFGTAYFKFAIVNGAGTATYWSNDGSSSGGQLPSTGIELPVINGLFTVGLGDTRLVNMVPVPTSAFSATDSQLRVWFSTSPNSGYQLLTPDQQLRSVPYAHVAGSVAAGGVAADGLQSGVVSESKLADGSVTEPKLGNRSVSTRTLADGSVTEAKLAGASISSRTIQSGAVDTSKVADRSVSEPKLADASVSGRTIQGGAVSSVHIVDGTISAGDLASDVASLTRVSGGMINLVNNSIAVGTGNPTALVDLAGSTRSVLDLLMAGGDATNAIFRIYRDGPKSSDTLVLSVNRAGTLTVKEMSLPSGAGFVGNEGGSLELGPAVNSAAAGPYIDFHYGVGASQDYNVRLRNDGNRRLSITGDGGADVTFRVNGTVVASSDRTKKTNIVELNHRASLATVLKLPVYSWSFTNSPADTHEGPMAQDWHRLTGLGVDDVTISPMDMSGKALSAIKGLYEVVQERSATIVSLEKQMAELKAQVANMEATVAALAKAARKSAIQEASFRPEAGR